VNRYRGSCRPRLSYLSEQTSCKLLELTRISFTWLIMAALGSAGCKPKPAAKKPLVGWSPVGNWSGRGDTQTDSFNIEAGQWRIRWQTSNEDEPGAGRFRLTVHSAVSGRPLKVAVDHRGVGRDVAYVNDDPRLYHLVIESSGVDWHVKVEEAVVAYQ